MQDQVDLLNVNQIVSISVNQNRLKQVFLMMMTKLNHHAARIYKLQTNHKLLQQSTERSIYSVQQRIQFNEKETDNNISKVYMTINENKGEQEIINGKIEKMIVNKEREMGNMKERIEEVGEQMEERLGQSSKELGFLSVNLDEMREWKDMFEGEVKEKVQKLREELISVEARVSYSYKPPSHYPSAVGKDLVNHLHKPNRQRNSQFVARKSYMPRGPKLSMVNYNDVGLGLLSGHTLNHSMSDSKFNHNGDFDEKRNQNTQFVKEKLSCIEEELERQRRIVDRKLINTIDERMYTESSRDGYGNQISKFDKLDGNSRVTRRVQTTDQLRKQVLKAIKQMQGKMNQCKVPQDEFDKTVHSLNQKIHLLQMLVVNKCDKTEVKNAFTFLEKKLKQLILVVTNNEIEEKDGMLTQQPIKCLSCNNFVEKQNQKIDYSYWKIIKGKQFNSLLEMKNDMRNLKTAKVGTSEGNGKRRELERKTQANSVYDRFRKGNNDRRRESKSVIYSNQVIEGKENK